MPPAARITDMHTCPEATPGTPPIPHVGGPIVSGSPNVIIGDMPAARVTDTAICVGPPDTIVKGSPTVLINGLMAARIGDATTHGGVIVAGFPTVMIGDAATGGASFGPGPMSPPAAAALFAIMASQGDIAFKYPTDGCYARAHLMVQRMQQLGATPGKVWSFAGSPTDPLWVTTPNDPAGYVTWGYHVAPTVPVQQPDGTVQDMVIDPSIYDHPVPVGQWKDIQNDSPTISQTQPGQPPPGSAGSGYWPAADPVSGADADAAKTMKQFKRMEGQ